MAWVISSICSFCLSMMLFLYCSQVATPRYSSPARNSTSTTAVPSITGRISGRLRFFSLIAASFLQGIDLFPP